MTSENAAGSRPSPAPVANRPRPKSGKKIRPIRIHPIKPKTSPFTAPFRPGKQPVSPAKQKSENQGAVREGQKPWHCRANGAADQIPEQPLQVVIGLKRRKETRPGLQNHEAGMRRTSGQACDHRRPNPRQDRSTIRMSGTVSPDFERLHDGHFSDQVEAANQHVGCHGKDQHCESRRQRAPSVGKRFCRAGAEQSAEQTACHK